jgi:hypothetical protein
LAWLGTGLVVLTFPFVARATFDEYDGGSDAVPMPEDALPTDAPSPPSPPVEDAPIVDGGLPDATGTQPDGARTTFGDDAGGISCSVGGPIGDGNASNEAREATLAACTSCAAVGLLCARRRARGRRRGVNDA